MTQRAHRAGDKILFIPAIRASDVLAARYFLSLPVYFQEIPAPETARMVNLEAGFLHGTGLNVKYALNDPTNLRHSLEQRGVEATGLDAFLVLYEHVPAEDLDTMRELWDLYPGAIIEASVFSRAVGIQNRQTIFWEVRNY